MKKRKLSTADRAIILISALLLAANALLGHVLVDRAKRMMREMIAARMLDISNTAAAMLDGEALKNLTAGEENTPAYRAIYDALRLFQDNADLEYIYTVRDIGSGAFIFLIDPSEENTAAFGELVTVTAALKTASLGTPAVDEEPRQDSYGRFYSAYSPVFEKGGRVAAVVATDFSADWYDRQVSHYTGTVLTIGLCSLAVGALVVFLAFLRLRRRFRALDGELSKLTDDLDELTEEIGMPMAKTAGGAESGATDGTGDTDEAGELGARIHAMRKDLRQYIDHMYSQANSMITALASDYRSVYYVDLDTDEGICYRAHSKLENGLREGEKFSFRDVFEDYAQQYVAESYREGFLHFIQPGAIRAGLDRETIISYRYLVIKDGHESYEMLRMAGVRHPEDRTDGMVHAVGVGFSDVDRETRESMAQRQALSDALAKAEE